MKGFRKSIMMGVTLALLLGAVAGAASAPQNLSESMLTEGETEILEEPVQEYSEVVEEEPAQEYSSEAETPEASETGSEDLEEEPVQAEPEAVEEEPAQADSEAVEEEPAQAEPEAVEEEPAQEDPDILEEGAQAKEEKTEEVREPAPEAATEETVQTEELQTEEDAQTEENSLLPAAVAEPALLDDAYLSVTWTRIKDGKEDIKYTQGTNDAEIADIASGLWDLKVEIKLQVEGEAPILEGCYACRLVWPAHADQGISFDGGASGDILINDHSGYGTWALSELGELSLEFKNIDQLSNVSGWIETSLMVGEEETIKPGEDPAEPSIEKEGLFDAAAQKVFWTVEVTVPAWDGGPVYSWCVRDTERTTPASWSGSFKNDYSQMIVDKEEGTAWLYEEAEDGSVRIWFLNLCTCGTDACEGEEPGQSGCSPCSHIKYTDASGQAWCTCWHRMEDSRFSLCYSADTAELQQQMQESGRNEVKLINDAELQQSGEWAGESFASAQVHQAIKKAESERPNTGNDYSSTCTITVNPSFDDYSSAEQIEVTDVMDNLTYINESLQVICRYSDGTEGTLTQMDGNEAAALGREGNENRFFSIESAGDGRSFTVSLWYPTQASYTLLYRAAVTELLPGAENTYQNTAALGKVSSTVIGRGFRVDDAWFGETFEAVVLKIDAAGKTEAPEGLAGAVFEVRRFSEEGEDILVDTLITGEDGRDVFRTSRKKGILVEQNTLYYLQETEAPKGYERNEEKYYFYFSPADDMVLPDGITAVKGEKKEDTDILTYTLMLTVPDEAIPTRELPAAGGPGDVLFLVIGLFFVAASKGTGLLKGMH